ARNDLGRVTSRQQRDARVDHIVSLASTAEYTGCLRRELASARCNHSMVARAAGSVSHTAYSSRLDLTFDDVADRRYGSACAPEPERRSEMWVQLAHPA